MTDRELLELAAKAIGEEFHSGHITVHGQQFEWIEWNPLTDDGDALRLAVRLKLDIVHSRDGVEASSDNDEGIGYELYGEQGRETAARRAIVRAAAEIGIRAP